MKVMEACLVSNDYSDVLRGFSITIVALSSVVFFVVFFRKIYSSKFILIVKSL